MKTMVDGKYDIEDFKPKIEDNTILFPINAYCEYVEEDGLSFGYPVDCGWVTTIEYDYTVGALTEDTIALAQQAANKPRAPHSGVCPIKSFQWSDRELDSWQEGLDPSWAEKEFNKWQDEGLIDEDETEEEWINNRLGNYHCWPQEWKELYDSHIGGLNSPDGETVVILKNGTLTLYQDRNGDYFFTSQYHNYGKIEKADKADAKRYIAEYEQYKEKLHRYNELNKEIAENMAILKGSL